MCVCVCVRVCVCINIYTYTQTSSILSVCLTINYFKQIFNKCCQMSQRFGMALKFFISNLEHPKAINCWKLRRNLRGN